MTHIDTSDIVRASVWIRPTGSAFDQIQHVINLVHKRAGGPPLQPHITVLSGIETTQASAELKLKHLAMRTKPFKVQLGTVSMNHDYFRCLFAVVLPNEALEALHRIAHEVFEMNPPDPFEPHLSLLYGNIDDRQKKSLIDEIGSSLDLAFEVTNVQLVNASPSVPVTAWRILCERTV